MLSRFTRSFTRNMTMTSIANLQRISAKTLSDKILAEQGKDSSIAIIDVRDNGKKNN
jgi:hypothetical protein